ncbi:uncharacterized protein [Argopecten irradians]|uniref:uncharacterized protein isoform X4 n=1 Tax=Argopecten irradians TaxID=31199 RepID=UPI00371AE297
MNVPLHTASLLGPPPVDSPPTSAPSEDGGYQGKDGMVLKLPTSSNLLSRLYANNGVRIRMHVGRKKKTPKIPTVRDLIDQFSKKHERLLEMEEQKLSSSSTPTVPYSTADILYGNEVRQSPQVDDIRQNSFIDYNPKDRERLGSRDLSDQSGRRPGSKGGSRKSLSIEKVSFGKESEDNLRPILPSSKQTNQYRPNGLRSSLLKGEPLFSSRSHTSGKDADELIAMGTIWSPGAQQSQQPPQKNHSGPSQSAPGKTVSTGTGSNSSTTLSQTRKYGSNVKPIMVQNAPASSMKNNIKDGKLEPKYTDPLVGAPASFQQRLMELSALEAETVRYERSKKVKKKVKQDRDS